MRKASLGAGYLAASNSKYGNGFAYGGSIIEGTGRFGFGLSFLSFTNSFTDSVLAINPGTMKLENHVFRGEVTDFYISVLALYLRDNPKKGVLMLAGFGPEIHFLQASSQDYVADFRSSGSDSRLGMGAILRYEKVIRMFGTATFVVTAAWSWMQAGIEVVDEFTPPTEGMTAGAVTVGLAFPF
jgi:hypothetical protein